MNSRMFWRIEALLLLLLLPFVLTISPATSPALLALPLIPVLRRRATGRYLPHTPLNLSLVLLLLAVLVSLFATPDLAGSLPKVAGLLYAIVAFFATVDLASRPTRLSWQALALFLGTHLLIAVGSLLYVSWSRGLLLPALGGRLPAPWPEINPNQIAGALLWAAPLALVLTVTRLPAASTLPRAIRPLALLTASASAISLLLSQSVSSWMGMLAALLLILLASLPRRLGLSLLALLPAGFLLTYRELLPALWSQAALGATAVTSLDGRLEIWRRAAYGLQDFPFTGMGMGMFREVVHVLYPLFLISPETDIAHAHNHLLQTGLDLGIPGLIAYVAVWIGAAGMLAATWRRGTRETRTLALGFGSSLFAYFVYGLTDAIALGARPGFLFWVLLGLVVVLWQQTASSSAPIERTSPIMRSDTAGQSQ